MTPKRTPLRWVLVLLTAISLLVLVRIVTDGPSYYTLIAVCAVSLAVSLILTTTRHEG